MMSITGTPEAAPLKSGAQVVDYGAGLAASFGLATALFERERSGKGQCVDVSMLDTALVMMSSFVTDVLTAGAEPKAHGNKSSVETFGNTCFRCSCGGVLAIAAIEEHQRDRLWKAIERGDIPADPRFSSSEACRANILALHEEMGKAFLTRPAQEWEERLNEADVPAMRVRTIAEALEQPQLRGRNLLHTFDFIDGVRGSATVALAPFMLSAGGARVDSPPPRLGAHTDQILREMGRTPDDIAALRAREVL